MTKQEFKNLKIGEKIILNFSTFPIQYVVWKEGNNIITKPYDLSIVNYSNHFNYIKLYKNYDKN